MRRTKINQGWKFWKNGKGFSPLWAYSGKYDTVDLPHDAMLTETPNPESKNGGRTGYRDGGNYTYEKSIYIDEQRKGKETLLEFKGVYRNCQIYVNGFPAASHRYGYTSFYVPLKDGVIYGAYNDIRVVVHNGAEPNSRWYSGSGIYRNVFLLEAEEIFIIPESMKCKTVSADNDVAIVDVSLSIKNTDPAIQDAEVLLSITDREGSTITTRTMPFPIQGNSERNIRTKLEIKNPQFWDEYNPVLYDIRADIFWNNRVIDSENVKTGIRIMTMDSARGFQINGNGIKLRGACIHHDNGLLGAATYEDAEYRRVRQLKEAGFNAIRMSHHPMSEELLDACDTLGLYVMDESFDMWTRTKSDMDYSLDFDICWENDIEAMVRKDYNHPCVIMYSIGNEIPEISHDSGIEYLYRIADKVRNLDDTRYITSAITSPYLMGDQMMDIFQAVRKTHPEDEGINGDFNDADVNEFLGLLGKYAEEMNNHPITSERMDRICGALDLPGYNYMTGRYELDLKERPDRLIVGSETYPPEIGRNWNYIKAHRNVIGDFTWTGYDYLGEAGIGVTGYSFDEGGFGSTFPCKVAYCGDIDLTGYRRPQSFYREIVFGIRRQPYIATVDPTNYGKKQFKTDWSFGDQVCTWTYPGKEGLKTAVEVYSSAPEVELLLNNMSCGRKPCGEKHNYKAVFEVEYHPGKLEAININNELDAESFIIRTAEKSEIVVTREEETRNLYYFNIELKDTNGTLDTANDAELEIDVREGKLLAFGSGDPRSEYSYQSRKTKTFQGRALAIVYSNVLPEIIVTKV